MEHALKLTCLATFLLQSYVARSRTDFYFLQEKIPSVLNSTLKLGQLQVSSFLGNKPEKENSLSAVSENSSA